MLDWHSFYFRAALAFGVGSLLFIHSLCLYFHQRQQERRVLRTGGNIGTWGLWLLFGLLPIGFVTPSLSFDFGVITPLGLAISFTGLLLSCVSRHSLGHFWSHRAEVVADHRWKCDGVYHIWAHPVYFGEFLVAFGAVILTGHLFAVLYMLAVLQINQQKAVAEEYLLTKYLGPRTSEPLTRQIKHRLLSKSSNIVPQTR